MGENIQSSDLKTEIIEDFKYRLPAYRLNRKPFTGQVLEIKGTATLFFFCEGEILHGTLEGNDTDYAIQGETVDQPEGKFRLIAKKTETFL